MVELRGGPRGPAPLKDRVAPSKHLVWEGTRGPGPLKGPLKSPVKFNTWLQHINIILSTVPGYTIDRTKKENISDLYHIKFAIHIPHPKVRLPQLTWPNSTPWYRVLVCQGIPWERLVSVGDIYHKIQVTISKIISVVCSHYVLRVSLLLSCSLHCASLQPAASWRDSVSPQARTRVKLGGGSRDLPPLRPLTSYGRSEPHI